MMETEAVVAQGTLKVTCPRDELARALGVVSRGVSTRTTVQILAGILLHASDVRLQLAATDMELSLRTALDASIESDGSVVVPGRLLLELARLLPDAEVTIEHKLEEAAVEIRSGSATYRLHTYNAEDFPRLPDAGAAERMPLVEVGLDLRGVAVGRDDVADLVGRDADLAAKADERLGIIEHLALLLPNTL